MNRSVSKRCNNASENEVYRDVVFGEGSIKVVYKGKYTNGERAGQSFVVKDMRTGSTWLASVFDKDIEVTYRTVEIVSQFNDARHIDRPILVNRPAVWQYKQTCSPEITGSKFLVEPLIENYQKFNSNTG